MGNRKEYNQKREDLSKRGQSGFTIVELGVVLLIIGALLSAVMLGRDVVRGADIKRFQQQYIMKWVSIAGSYYDKTGRRLADSRTNGGRNNEEADGWMDGRAFGPSGGQQHRLITRLDEVGIDACNLVKSTATELVRHSPSNHRNRTNQCGDGGAVSQSIIAGEFSGPQIVSADFIGFSVRYNGGAGLTRSRNFAVFYNVPTDVAIALDTSIDGSNSGGDGNVLYLRGVNPLRTRVNVNSLQTADDWPRAAAASGIGGAEETVVMAIALDF